MIADFPTKHATQRANELVDDVWAHIPTDLPSEKALRVATRAFALLATSSDTNKVAGRVLLGLLGLGLMLTAAYALLSIAALAWAAAAVYALAVAAWAWVRR